MPQKSISEGMQFPENFNVKSYDEINEVVARYVNSHRREWSTFVLGWKGLAYRFRAAVEFDLEFHAALGGRDFEERFIQEKALHSFFVSALSAISCFFYGAYALRHSFSRATFP